MHYSAAMHGLHLTADLHDCRCDGAWLTDAHRLTDRCAELVAACGLRHVARLAHAFDASPQGPGGVTATLLLAESHLCVHTWPERSAVTLDVYVCNYGGDHSARARALMESLLTLFAPTRVEQHALERGRLAPEPDMPVRALVLAAGRGERMRPLTDTCPKPLLTVRGKPLLQWQLEALAAGGVLEVVINTAWLGEQIEARFGASLDTPAGPLALSYSHEGRDFGGALETAGGIVRALPRLGEVFWVVAGDVFAPGFRFEAEAVQRFRRSGRLAHVWLVPNPPHNPRGDFGLAPDGRALNLPRDAESPTAPLRTFSTIGLYRAAMFSPPLCDIAPGNPQGIHAPLAPLLRAAMDNDQVSAALYDGDWTDVGTPERLAQLNTPTHAP